MDSYEIYLQAGAFYNKRMSAAARPPFEKAYELDPQFASAYALAATTIAWQQGTDGLTLTAEMRAEAFRLANVGAELGNEDALALARCGHVLVYLGREYDRGRSMIEQAVALNPNLAAAWYSLGWIIPLSQRFHDTVLCRGSGGGGRGMVRRDILDVRSGANAESVVRVPTAKHLATVATRCNPP